MTTTHINRLRCSIANTPGLAGNVVVCAATSAARRTFTAAEDGKSFEPTFEDGNNWEVRTGCVYTHATSTLTRGTLVDSSTGSAVDLTSATVVGLHGTAKAMQDLEPARSGIAKSIATAQLSEAMPLTVATVTPKTVGFANFDIQYNSFANSAGGAGTYNHGTWIGYNAGRHSAGSVVSGKSALLMGFEDNYYDHAGTTKYGPEWYVEYWSPDGTSQQMLRPFYVRVDSDNGNAASNCTITHDIGSDGTGSFQVYAQGMGSRTALMTITPTAISLSGTVSLLGATGFIQTPLVRGYNGANKDLLLGIGSATGQIILQNFGGSANLMQMSNGGDFSFKDGAALNAFGATGFKLGGSSSQKFGFYGATPIVRPTGTPAAATDLATAIALVNSLRASLVALGLIS